MCQKALIERFETLKARKHLLGLKRVYFQDHDDRIKDQIEQAHIERLKKERIKNLKTLEGVLKEMESPLKEVDKLLAALEWNPDNN